MPKRNEIDDKFKWNLNDICSSDADAEQRLEKVTALFDRLQGYRGRLGENDEILYEALELYFNMQRELEEAYMYAHFLLAQDNGDSRSQRLSQRAVSVYSDFQTAAAFIVPEITKMKADRLHQLENNPRFSDFARMIHEIIRQKKHILSAKEERILSMSTEMSGQFNTAFDMLSDVDMRFPAVKDESGKSVKLTHAKYRTLLESKERSVRKGAFNAMYKTYKSYANTIAAMYAGSIKKDLFYAKARGYDSTLEMFLDSDNVDKSVYYNLIDTVHDNLGTLQRYLKLRKQALGLSRLHMYDLYTPLVNDADASYTYDEAKALVKKGLAVLGGEYAELLDRAFSERWIDVYENEGKSSGAFCGSTYDSHPYVLLNFEGRLDDVFTAAHELGHAMHSYYSNKTQPYTNANYSIFVAEVASTVNEVLLLKYLLAETDSPKTKAYLLNHFLEQFRTTVVRQTMFAEFEAKVHAAAQRGEGLDQESLCIMYHSLNKFYYGSETVVDELIRYEWARIPHFYSAFYVYKYATGFSAAIAIAEKILEEGEPAVQKYKEFLSSGDSDYPIELLKIAGVDMSTGEPVAACMRAFNDTLEQLEGLI